MGWSYDEHEGHEGYVVACERVEGRWREISWPDDKIRERIYCVKVGCECGWRSPLLQAPYGSDYYPCACTVPEHFEDQARVLWREHVESCARSLVRRGEVFELKAVLR